MRYVGVAELAAFLWLEKCQFLSSVLERYARDCTKSSLFICLDGRSEGALIL